MHVSAGILPTDAGEEIELSILNAIPVLFLTCNFRLRDQPSTTSADKADVVDLTLRASILATFVVNILILGNFITENTPADSVIILAIEVQVLELTR